MKTKIIIFLIVFAGSKLVNSQDINKVKNLKSVVWFGLDFSNTKLVGTSYDFADLTKIKNHFFVEWNHLILRESEKYDIGRAYKIAHVENKIEIAIKRSMLVDTNSLISIVPVEITRDELPNFLKDYKIETKSEIGLVYIVESLDKANLTVTAWETFFNIQTGEILYAIKSEGRVGGFGFRNYWIRGVYNILYKTTNY
jgi:hypothetical protein